jgi:hypothetical protein
MFYSSGLQLCFIARLMKSFSALIFLIATQAIGQTTYSFTECGATGRLGPSQTQVSNTYSSTNLSGSVGVTSTGIQTFTLPFTGTYVINAYGAFGGNAGYVGGGGARIQGTFNFSVGTVLKILVGQRGGSRFGINSDDAGAGGGGSFVTLLDNTPLIVAGGGGGADYNSGGFSGTVTLNGTYRASPDGAAGVNGGGGGGALSGVAGTSTTPGGTGYGCSYGAGGGGFYTRGGNNCSDALPIICGDSYVNGGAGGPADTGRNGVEGGFGGGAGVGGKASGGGGWSGGGGSDGNGGAGGGGSYNGGTNQTNQTNANVFSHGRVVITVYPCQVAGTPTNLTSGANMAVCSGRSTTLTVTNTGSLSWYDSPTSTLALQSGTALVTPTLSTGNYSYYVVATNTCGSSDRVQITVTVNTTPTVAVNSGTVCAGSPFVLSPGGAINYSYSGGSATVTPNSNTSYTVTGYSAEGCTNSAISSVTAVARPFVTVNSGAICNGNSFTINPTGASTHTVTGVSGFVVNPASTTSYSVMGTSAAGCASSNTAISTVTVHQLPVISANNGSICTGGIFTITPGGAGNYTFSSASATVNPGVTTSYSVTGTSTAGCPGSNTAVVTVSVYTTPTISVNSATICSGNSATITPSGAGSYTITGNSFVVSPVATTAYSVTGTSSAGCIASNTAAATVVVNTTPTISVNSATICAGSSVSLVPTGASVYSITGNSFTVSPAATTSYSVTGTSGAGCISSNTAVSTILVNSLPAVSASPLSCTICIGGSMTYSAGGGDSYLWSTGDIGTVMTVSPAATEQYTVTASNAANCKASVVVKVTVEPCLSVTDLSGVPDVEIYPNPFSRYVVVAGESTEQMVIEVFDQKGKLMRTFYSSGNSKLDFAHDPDGIYLLRVKRAGMPAKSVRVIKAD